MTTKNRIAKLEQVKAPIRRIEARWHDEKNYNTLEGIRMTIAEADKRQVELEAEGVLIVHVFYDNNLTTGEGGL